MWFRKIALWLCSFLFCFCFCFFALSFSADTGLTTGFAPMHCLFLQLAFSGEEAEGDLDALQEEAGRAEMQKLATQLSDEIDEARQQELLRTFSRYEIKVDDEALKQVRWFCFAWFNQSHALPVVALTVFASVIKQSD